MTPRLEQEPTLMDANAALALAQPVSSKIQGVGFRVMDDDPEDLEEFHAFYDADEQREVIARANAAVSAFLAGFEQVKRSPDGAKVYVRELVAPLRTLCRSLRAADPTFDPAPVEAALTSVTLARTKRALERAAAEQRSARPGAREAALEAFKGLATSKRDAGRLEAVVARAVEVTKRAGGTQVTFASGQVVTCARPGKPAGGVPRSYAALSRRFGSVLWRHAGASMGFLGVTRAGTLSDGSWEWQVLEEGDNATLLAALEKKKLTPRDVHCAFACGSNWILFDPTRKARSGDPALAFVSHGDGAWVPMKSADALDARGVLLRLLAWSIAGTPSGLEEISAA